ncbi:MAG TPA: TolC family protein [Steroidobacteraceae bacterium]|nr:TolC family protein [Steroidobacteraceae bacterium]
MKTRSTRARYACAMALALWAAAAGAASPGAGETLTRNRAIELAVTHSLAIAALTSQREALAARGEAEALSPSFHIESEFENFAGSGDASGADLLESTVRVSRVIELGDKAALRRGVGAAELDQLAAEQQLARADLAAEVARRFIHVLSDQTMLVTAKRATELARTARDVARERVTAGASSPAALGRAEIALARSEIEQEHAEHELAASRVKLSILWGDTAASFGLASGELFELPALESLDAYRSRLDASPELTRFASDARVQDARIRLAQAQRSPDVSVAAGIRRLEQFDDAALVAAFSVPLGTRRRADLHERAARADRSRVDMNREARRLELHATLFELYQELLHARTQAQTLHAQVRPQAEKMLTTTNEGYRAGRFSLLELADAQLQLIEVEREATEAAASYHTLMIEIRRLVGAP